MTDLQNAERLRKEYLTRTPRKTIKNICKALPNWNGCDYCDVYSGNGLECWKQNAAHKCVHIQEVKQ
jgi:hypothetical protein